MGVNRCILKSSQTAKKDIITLIIVKGTRKDIVREIDFIPTKFEIEVECNYSNLFEMIDRASLLTSDRDKNTIKLELNNDELTISSNSPEIGYVEEKMAVKSNGNISISFSSKYMLDAIRSFGEEKVVLYMNNDNSPIIVKSKEETSLIQLVLPIKTY